MRHEEARERLPELLTLHPASPDETALRAHVATCGECRALLADMAGIDRALRGLGAEEPGARLGRRILAIPNAAAKTPKHRRPWKLASTAAVLVAGLAVVLSVVLLRGGGSADGFPAGHAIALRGADPAVRAELVLGAPEGPNQPLRLVARGLSPTGAAYYTLWLSGPAGPVSAGTFRPDADGDCVVVGVVPRDVSWANASITRADAPPGSAHTVATGRL